MNYTKQECWHTSLQIAITCKLSKENDTDLIVVTDYETFLAKLTEG